MELNGRDRCYCKQSFHWLKKIVEDLIGLGSTRTSDAFNSDELLADVRAGTCCIAALSVGSEIPTNDDIGNGKGA